MRSETTSRITPLDVQNAEWMERTSFQKVRGDINRATHSLARTQIDRSVPMPTPTSLDRRLERRRSDALGSLVALWAHNRLTPAIFIWSSYCIFHRRQDRARAQILRRCGLILQRRIARTLLARGFHKWRAQMPIVQTPKASKKTQATAPNTTTPHAEESPAKDPPSSTTGWTWTPTEVTNIFMEFCDRIAVDKGENTNNNQNQSHDVNCNYIDASSHSPFDQTELTRMISTLEHWQQQYNPRPSPNDRVHEITLS